MLYSIGYSGMRAASELLDLAQSLDAVIIDVRARPVSRKSGFSRWNLAAVLGERYEWHGDKLGGRKAGEKPAVTAEGIQLLSRRIADENLILMCLEHEPWLCHRHLDICSPYFPEAVHLLHGEDVGIRAMDVDAALA